MMLLLTFDTMEEERLFHYLYYKYYRLLYKCVNDILKNHHDTEDALQISWNKISQNIKKIEERPERQRLNFMVIVARNSAIDIYNKKNKNTVSYNEAILDLQQEHAIDAYTSLELSDFVEALNQLAATYRDPLVLMYTYGYSIKEISDILDISESNVGTKIYRAKNMIKKIISERTD